MPVSLALHVRKVYAKAGLQNEKNLWRSQSLEPRACVLVTLQTNKIRNEINEDNPSCRGLTTGFYHDQNLQGEQLYRRSEVTPLMLIHSQTRKVQTTY